MKLVYIDEAGISSFAHEPHLVVAAVIISPDTQWKQLERYYSDLAQELFPEEYFYGFPYEEGPSLHKFVFHAKDIWHGSGPFKRKKWSRHERIKIMARLAQVPGLFDLRVAIGIVDRAKYKAQMLREAPKTTGSNIQIMTHAYAFMMAVQNVEIELSKKSPNEVAMLIVEDSPKVQSVIRMLHDGYTGIFEPEDYDVRGVFISDRIVDTVHFAKKKDSLLLQIADHCAFVIKRQAMKCKDIPPLFAQIKPHLVYGGKPLTGVFLRTESDHLKSA